MFERHSKDFPPSIRRLAKALGNKFRVDRGHRGKFTIHTIDPNTEKEYSMPGVGPHSNMDKVCKTAVAWRDGILNRQATPA